MYIKFLFVYYSMYISLKFVGESAVFIFIYQFIINTSINNYTV